MSGCVYMCVGLECSVECSVVCGVVESILILIDTCRIRGESVSGCVWESSETG